MRATAETIFLNICVLAKIIPGVITYDYCSNGRYCEDGYNCCDDNTQCCSDTALAIGAIIGIVIGCIIFISCIVAVICCVTKQRHRRGHVNQPAQPAGVAVITTGQQQGPPGCSQPGYGQPMYEQQPMYGHQPYAQQQPSGQRAGTRDPAYPPAPPADYY